MAKNNFFGGPATQGTSERSKKAHCCGCPNDIGGIAAEGSRSAAAYTGAIGGVTAIRQGLSKRVQATNQELRLRELVQRLQGNHSLCLRYRGKNNTISAPQSSSLKNGKRFLKESTRTRLAF